MISTWQHDDGITMKIVWWKVSYYIKVKGHYIETGDQALIKQIAVTNLDRVSISGSHYSDGSERSVSRSAVTAGSLLKQHQQQHSQH